MRTDKNGNFWAKHNQTYTRIKKDSVSNVRKMVEDELPIEDKIKKPTD